MCHPERCNRCPLPLSLIVKHYADLNLKFNRLASGGKSAYSRQKATKKENFGENLAMKCSMQLMDAVHMDYVRATRFRAGFKHSIECAHTGIVNDGGNAFSEKSS